MKVLVAGALGVALSCLLFAALLMKLWLWKRELLVRHWQVCDRRRSVKKLHLRFRLV
jgi:hypothetical protein